MGNQSLVDEAALKRLGARGMIKPSATALQVVVGTEADQVAGEMKIALRASRAAPTPAAQAMSAAANAASSMPAHTSGTAVGNSTHAASTPDASSSVPDAAAQAADAAVPAAPPIPTPTLSSLLSALGGRSNILAIETASTRLRINIADPKVVNESAIAALGLRGVAHAAPNWLHVIVGPQAATAGVTLRQLL
jgi:PTS system N-acetylglucosamine-specific IIC component